MKKIRKCNKKVKDALSAQGDPADSRGERLNIIVREAPPVEDGDP